MYVGVTTKVKFRVLPFMVKIQDLTLIGCLRHCFETRDYFQGKTRRSFIRRRERLCNVLFLEASFLESLKFRCYLGRGCIVVARATTLFLDFYFFISFTLFGCVYSYCY
jgi:hypothetical protein